MPWTAYCRNMNTNDPLEYLPLSSPQTNFGQFAAGGMYATGTTCTTSYSKLRLVVSSGMVDVSDRTFSTSTGNVMEGGNHPANVTSMPYAVAASCNDTAGGVAEIDLTGTPFQVAAGAFAPGGYLGQGSATYASNDQVVKLTGGGYCGWESPGTLTDPPSESGGAQLPLVYP
jgi:hypothetical protein